jgi:hypothetical protein
VPSVDCLSGIAAFQCRHARPTRRNPEASEEHWHIHYGEVRVGTIAIRTGSWSFILIFSVRAFLV